MCTESLREHRAQDVGFLGIGERAENINVVDVLLEQQLLVGRVADQDNCLVQLFRNVPRADRVAFDQLDLVGLLQRQRKTQTDIATARDDHAPNRVLKTPHFTHEHANVFAVGDEEYFVAFLDDGVALRQHRLALAVDGGDAALSVWNVIFQGRDALADQQTLPVCFGAHESHATISKVENL